MVNEQHEGDNADGNTTERGSLDPRDTEHPTGSAQAAENAQNDPPA